ncbi:MAG: EAL domain-containing protein [Gammaproteobacteria bacterium]|nr:EAL domain-containing protein [Gammaproteobacteria bacterium]
MHNLLKRQLKKAGLDLDTFPSSENWQQFLESIDRSYQQSDQDRYVLERSLSLSSTEMQELYQRLKETYKTRESAILNAFPDLLFLIDEDGKILELLAGNKDNLYKPEQEIIGQLMTDILPKKPVKLIKQCLDHALQTNEMQLVEYELEVPSGSLHFEGRAVVMGELPNGKRGILFFSRDITDRVQSGFQQKLLESVLSSATEGIVIMDAGQRVLYANQAVSQMTGLTVAELINEGQGFLRQQQDQKIYQKIYDQARAMGHFQQEVIIHHQQGDQSDVLLSMDTKKNDQDETEYIVAILTDISEIKASQVRYEHLATHDILTGLPNRRLLEERLRQAVSKARRNQFNGVLFFLDLDRFKTINDSLGHGVGDRLLYQVASRLIRVCRIEDTVARFGGDEFVVLVDDIRHQEQAFRIAEKILRVFDKSFHIQGHELNISTSIGISLFPDHGTDVEQLVKHADIAMYAAKNLGRDRYQVFTDEHLESAVAGITMEYEITNALDNEEFFLMFQPQYMTCSRDLSGFEALIRWQHPKQGLVPPGEFIPVAEASGQIEQIGLWVFEQICLKVVAWNQAGLKFNRLSFNLSQRQLMDGKLAQKLIGVMQRTGAINYAGQIECEITESLIIEQTDIALETINRLKQTGMLLAIDDFGTGHSSLVNLKRFPLDRLKIDREFVRDIGRDQNDEAIIRATIALAQGFGLEVIAEGVEEEYQLDFLREVGCQEVQGYLLNRPLSIEQCEAQMREQSDLPQQAQGR